MKRSGFLRELFSRRAESAVAKVKSDVVALPNWGPLIQAIMQRAEKLGETDLFMVQFKNSKSKSSFSEYPTLVIGSIKPILSPTPRKSEVFVSVMGQVSAVTEPGSEEANWMRLGFQLEQSKRTKSFGIGPVAIDVLPEILFSAMHVFSLFYGVSSESRVRTTGDRELEEILNNSAGLKRIKLGEYRLR
jgi:hypothetical protein